MNESAALTVDTPTRRRNDNAAKDETIEQSTKWTNEKHNMYLGYLEASFVSQLRGSKRLFGAHAVQQALDPNLPDQFTVLHSGHWKKIKFENVARDSHVVSRSPSIRHFRSASKRPIDVSSDVRDKRLPSSIGLSLPGLSKGDEQLHAGHRDSDSSISEGSDQNFEDEYSSNQPSDSSAAKRLKVLESDDPSSYEQVVPSQATTANNTSISREARVSHQFLHTLVCK